MGLYYVSLADEQTGDFVGGVFLNRPTADEAQLGACRVAWEAGAPRCLEAKSHVLPPGAPPVEADCINRLLSFEELASTDEVVPWEDSEHTPD
jgi:hypothetical protein